jgi:hypothetical protein
VSISKVGISDTYVPSAFSDPRDGTYMATGLAPGDYRLLFWDAEGFMGWSIVPHFYPQAYQGVNLDVWQMMEWNSLSIGDLVHVPAVGAGPKSIDATLALEPAAISGTVRDEHGDPVGGISAMLYWESELGGDRSWLFSVPVDADGNYAFRGIDAMFRGNPTPPNPSNYLRFYVAFSDETSGAWSPRFYGGGQEVSAAVAIDCSGTPRTGIDATLTPTSVSVTGTVTSASGTPIPGAVIEASYIATPGVLPSAVRCRSAADGSYELKGLPDGSHTLIAYSPSEPLEPAWRDVTFAGTVLPGVNFVLGSPLSGAEYSTYGSGWQDSWFDALEHQWADGYADATDVVVTTGDDKYAHEAACAPGLCWAYQVTKPGSPNLGKNAPLVQVQRTGDPLEAAQVIAGIGLHNGTADHHVAVHVVGTKTGVPDRVLDRLRQYAAALGVRVTVDRLASKSKATRYELAGAVALRMRARARASASDAIAMPGYAFIANGDHSGRVMGAVACTSVSAAKGVPVLLVGINGVPRATTRALKTLKVSSRRLLVVGDRFSVSEKVRKRLKARSANRLTGSRRASNRYTVALAVANMAIAKKWCSARTVAIAETPADAVVGGALSGDDRGVLVLQDTNAWDGLAVTATGKWVRAYASRIQALHLVGYEPWSSESEWEELVPSQPFFLDLPFAAPTALGGVRSGAEVSAVSEASRSRGAASPRTRQLADVRRLGRLRAAAAILGVR